MMKWAPSRFEPVTVHLFPQNQERDGAEPVTDSRFYPDLSKGQSKKRLPHVAKRVIDVIGSASLLLLLSPLLAIVAIAIKLTSKGPVIFRQERLGQFGSRFKCLADGQNNETGKPVVYKLTNDSRVTPLGRFLRKTSLDEFPQFWNVLTWRDVSRWSASISSL